MLMGEGLQDSETLCHVSAVVVDPDGKLGANTVGSGCLDRSPSSTIDSLILKLDVLRS